MSYQTIIRASQVSEADLIALVEQIQIITKSQVTIEQNFVITTESVNVSKLLDNLVNALPVNKQTALPAVRRNGHKPKDKKKTQVMGPRSMRIVATDEIVSSRELKKRIASGEIPEFAAVTNGKGEFVVIDGKLVKGPQS